MMAQTQVSFEDMCKENSSTKCGVKREVSAFLFFKTGEIIACFHVCKNLKAMKK